MESETAQTAADPAPSDEPTQESSDPTAWVVGYPWGEMPAIPPILLPDLGLLEDSLDGFTAQFEEISGDYPGLTISPARCDEAGTVQAQNGALLLYGDGSGNLIGPDGTTQNFGDGSGNFTVDGVSVQVFGDGSGNYVGESISIQNFGDGSGNYSDSDDGLSVQVFGDGSGNYADETISIQNFGDGSGNYSNSETGVTIQNFGDGSGNYTDDTISIQNFGDGSGLVDGTDVELEPTARVMPMGSFPPMGVIDPITACGTTITMDSGVLFDIDQYSIRPDAATVLDSLAQALTDLAVPAAEVAGHTDDVRDDAWNQTLSENRASAVVDALTEHGVGAAMTAVGYGESRPIAANIVDGVPDPAGRQLNRRVEIFIPAF
ncbi:MAG: OmpA family protein [Beutenbergiaceae bacterium]